MRLIIDQDEVICRWLDRILEWYNADKGTSFTRNDVKMWDVTTNLGPQSEDFIRSCMRYPELYRDLDPVPGAIDGIKTLLAKGHDVVIATAIPSCAGIAYHGKLEWIRRNMPFFDLNNFVSIQRKELLMGDLILDDGPHNIEAWRKMGRTTVVFDAPWNADTTSDFRVKTWEEFGKLVSDIQADVDAGYLIY